MENKIESKEDQRRRLQEEDDSSSSSRATRWVTATTVEIELEVLDCPICYGPLKPPVFQCAVGHVVCSCCCAKLARKCPTCGAATGFSRCFAVEHIVESVRVPCVNVGCGWCAAKTPYYGKEEHEETCLHAEAAVTGPACPCRCCCCGPWHSRRHSPRARWKQRQQRPTLFGRRTSACRC